MASVVNAPTAMKHSFVVYLKGNFFGRLTLLRVRPYVVKAHADKALGQDHPPKLRPLVHVL